MEEYLTLIGQDNSYIVEHQRRIAGAVNYDDEDEDTTLRADDLSPKSSLQSQPPSFDVLRSANTLAMLLKVFGDKILCERKTSATKDAFEADGDANSSSPKQHSLYNPLSPASKNFTNASPMSPIFSPTPAATAHIDCWVEEGEMAMSIEALRRFKAAVGLCEKETRGGNELGKRPLLPPALISIEESSVTAAKDDDQELDLVSTNTDVDSHAECRPIHAIVRRPAVRVVWQKKPPHGVGSDSTSRMERTLPVPVALSSSPHKVRPISANASRRQHSSAVTDLNERPENTSAEDKGLQHETVIADIQRMVAEMRNSAFTMKETLKAEAGAMDDTAQLLQTATSKTVEQTTRVDGMHNTFQLKSGDGVVGSILHKVLPSAVATMLMQSLGAVITLIKTMLWVVLVLSVTAATLFVILMRKKATVITVEETEEML